MDKELMVEDISIGKDGSLDLSLSGEPAKLFMQNLILMFERSGAKNFLTVTVKHGEDEYDITIQNSNGNDVPASKLRMITEENKALRKALLDMRFAYLNKDNPPHDFEINALEETNKIIGEIGKEKIDVI